MNTYHGTPDDNEGIVTVQYSIPSLKRVGETSDYVEVRRRKPKTILQGKNLTWGHGWPPAEQSNLAHVLLTDALGGNPNDWVDTYEKEFEFDILSKFIANQPWELTSVEIVDWVLSKVEGMKEFEKMKQAVSALESIG